MYFKKIYMHGFKSFADPVTIEFHKGITCIVGPNGSGKEQYFRCHTDGCWESRVQRCFEAAKWKRSYSPEQQAANPEAWRR